MITVNGKTLDVTMFPDGTSQVWHVSAFGIRDTNYVHVVWDFSSESEFMHIAQLKSLIDYFGYKSTLRIKFLPYGRQDKPVSNSTTFALCTFSALLNTLAFDEVIIHDPHSRRALELINNSTPKYDIDTVESIYRKYAEVVCYPDVGATTKYSPLYGLPFLVGEKTRDQQTGQIINYELIGSPKDRNVLIVDDICDGGATFVILAKALKEAGAQEVNLFVSHGIFSKGLSVLKDAGISRIFTSDGEASESQGVICYEKLS